MSHDDELQDLLDRALDGTLDAESQARLEERTRDPATRRQWEALRRVTGAGRAMRGALPPDGFAERVAAAVGGGRAARVSWLASLENFWFRPRLSPAWMPAVAVASAILALFASSRLAPVETRAIPVAAAPVRFVYYGEAAAVTLSGTFNRWSTSEHAMQSVRPGVWVLEVPLPAGRHEYAFVVKGPDGVSRWVADPAAPVHVDDGFGQANARIEI